MVRTYNSKEVSVIIGTTQIKGFVEGSFVTVTRDEQAFTKTTGSDGEVTRSKTNNKSGNIKLVLQAGSPSNDFLSALSITDEVSGQGIVPSLIKDNSGTSVAGALQTWVQKQADLDRARDSGEVEWILDTGAIDIFVGGNNV